MSEWKQRAACRDHPNPEWWFPRKVSDRAIDAKEVCVRCPVRRECGNVGVDSHEKFAVMGGYRCSSPSERAALRKWLGRFEPYMRTCRGCGTEFKTQQNRHNCLDCRGLVPIGPVRAHIQTLRAAGLTIAAISTLSAVPANTVTKLAIGHSQYEWLNCKREIADRILGVEPPEAVSA